MIFVPASIPVQVLIDISVPVVRVFVDTASRPVFRYVQGPRGVGYTAQ